MPFHFDALGGVGGECQLLTLFIKTVFFIYVVYVVIATARAPCNMPLHEMHVLWLIGPFAIFMGIIIGLFGAENLGSIMVHFYFFF